MKITERKLDTEHSAELLQLLNEVGEACRQDWRYFAQHGLTIRMFLDTCRERADITWKPVTLKPSHVANPKPILGSKVGKHAGDDVYEVIDALARERFETGEVYDNSTVAAALNKLLKPVKRPKRR